MKAGGIRFPSRVCEGRIKKIWFTRNAVLFLENGTAGLTQNKNCGDPASYLLDGFGEIDLFSAVSRDCRLSIGEKDCALKVLDGFYKFEIDFDTIGQHHISVAFLRNGETSE